MRTRQNYGWLDRFRVIVALLAITNHTAALSSINDTADFFLTRVLARIVVPFFLMVTGQFVAADFLTISRKNGPRLIKYIQKTSLFYLFSILLYLPIGIYADLYHDIGFGGALRLLIFDGTFYHLWYFPACIIGMLLIFVMSRKLTLRTMTVISAILYVIGLFGDSYYGLMQKVPVLDAVYEFGFRIFSYTRNGLFIAPLFLVLGIWMSVLENNRETDSSQADIFHYIAGLILSFAVMTIEAFTLRHFQLQRHDSMYLALIPTMFFLYQCLLHLPKNPSKSCRTASTWIYILHPAFIVVVRAIAKLLKQTELLVNNSVVFYLAVTFLSTAAALVIVYIEENVLPKLRPAQNVIQKGTAPADSVLNNSRSNVSRKQQDNSTKALNQYQNQDLDIFNLQGNEDSDTFDYQENENPNSYDLSGEHDSDAFDLRGNDGDDVFYLPENYEANAFYLPEDETPDDFNLPQNEAPDASNLLENKAPDASNLPENSETNVFYLPENDGTDASNLPENDGLDASNLSESVETNTFHMPGNNGDNALYLAEPQVSENIPPQNSRIPETFHLQRNEDINVLGQASSSHSKVSSTSRAWIEVDSAALAHNVEFLRSCLPKHCRLMPAVKADAYGHGAVIISRLLNQMAVDSFCVACLSEGIALREAGIKGEILILGYTAPVDLPLLVHYELTQTVVDYPYAQILEQSGLTLHVHVAIDTGMHRLGLRCENMEEILAVYQMKHLVIDGLFTHLPASDSLRPEDKIFTDNQIRAFYQVVTILKNQGCHCRGLHMLASYGILRLVQEQERNTSHLHPSTENPIPLSALAADYVRPGIALYGVLSTENDNDTWWNSLQPVLSLKAKIASTRILYAGEAAGYGLAYTAKQDMHIAAISIGYADGLPRELSYGKGSVLIDGHRAPIIGRICMDQTIVDISNIPHVKAGNTAVIIGKSEKKENTAGQLAEQCGTITNELLSRLSSRLERITIS